MQTTTACIQMQVLVVEWYMSDCSERFQDQILVQMW